MAVEMSWTPLREFLLSLSTISPWKVLAIIFALLNIKNLPFAWHLRVLTGFYKHLFVHPARLTLTTGPSALFLPMKIASRVPFLDCDYNLHKSNSTYFADLDMARLHLVVGLASSGMAKTATELGMKGPLGIILGGTSCNFRREIKPYQGFEIWSRILCWDQKWLYVISHFVKTGSVRPRGYVLQPWRKAKARGDKREKEGSTNEQITANGDSRNPEPNPALFATGIAKYVFKNGRLTIPPERVLQNANLLPPRPEPASPPPSSSTPSPDHPSPSTPPLSALPAPPPLSPSPSPSPSPSTEDKPNPEQAANDTWDWDRIERERARGMQIANMYAGLELLNGEFRYDGGLALGEYRDLY